MRRLEVSAEAELEIFEAALRYEREREGLGFRFEAPVHTVFTRLVDGLPRSVVYELENGSVIVFAIAHHSRRPGYWSGRLIN